jgi:hypothetical protein
LNNWHIGLLSFRGILAWRGDDAEQRISLSVWLQSTCVACGSNANTEYEVTPSSDR